LSFELTGRRLLALLLGVGVGKWRWESGSLNWGLLIDCHRKVGDRWLVVDGRVEGWGWVLVLRISIDRT
jgi:hypothetical protein